jgi:mannitol/fructose-specific phosphotransferase system IIA component (Ntr-type)
MDIRDLLLKNVMIMDLKGTSKEAVIDEMVAKYHAEGIVTDENEYRQDILKREAESTTGIGMRHCNAACQRQCGYSSNRSFRQKRSGR